MIDYKKEYESLLLYIAQLEATNKKLMLDNDYLNVLVSNNNNNNKTTKVKLIDDDIKINNIKNDYSAGATIRDIVNKYNVTLSVAYKIINS